MYNLKSEPNLIFLIGVISYLYLFSSLVNKQFNIIFIYFSILFIGYFVVGKSIYKYNLIIILTDFLYFKRNLREGNFDSKFDKGKSNAESNEKFTKEGGSIDLGGDTSEDDGNELIGDFDKKNETNQKKKEAGKK
jgi:hypothetical protein|tara:strand:- start:11565 stop:11969 length:405 start_codon:yes stop_codon:yes gene_type:complete